MKKEETTQYREVNFTRQDWATIGLLASTVIPFILVIFFGWGGHAPLWVAISTGLAIVAGAYFLSWATESLQTVVSQAIALAILALIQVAPEYAFEMVLAWEQKIEFAAATMTGANRLLLGFGWPLIYFVAYFSAKRKKMPFQYIQLDLRQSVEVVFLLIAALYSLVIPAKASLSIYDGFILLAIYVAYVLVALRLPPENEEEEAEVSLGPAARLIRFRGVKKILATVSFLLFGFVVIFFGAEPFIHSLMALAKSLGISEYLFVQWFAPFLSEFPESLTAFIWSGMVILAPMGLANLVTSKLNQWTLLIASIPFTYSLSVGHIAPIPLDSVQVHEIVLTSAQTLYGVSTLLALRFDLRHALTLLILFLVQFLVPEIRIEVTILYLVMALYELYVHRKELLIFSEFKKALAPAAIRNRPRTEP